MSAARILTRAEIIIRSDVAHREAQRRCWPEPWFVTCPDCDGYGASVRAGCPSYWPDGSENNEETPCPTCAGTGRAEQEVQPVECDDDLPLTSAHEGK